MQGVWMHVYEVAVNLTLMTPLGMTHAIVSYGGPIVTHPFDLELHLWSGLVSATYAGVNLFHNLCYLLSG